MENFPFLSIILPVYNESTNIHACLLALLEQDYSADHMEMIIVDGMSTDNTRALVHDFATLHPHLEIHILDNPGKIVPTGMNVALCQAKGEIIIRVDGHCIIAPDYVRKCVEHIYRDEVDGVGGPMESIGETPIAKAIALGMSSSFGVGNSAFRTTSGKSMLADTVPFPAYTREIIQRAGLYDEELMRNQDDEYNYRIRELGGKILLAEDIRSQYFSRASLRGLWRQYFQYGLYKVRVLQKHPRQMSPRQFVPPVFVLALLFSAFLALSPVLRPLSLVVPVFYLSTNFLASTWTVIKKNRLTRESPLSTLYSLLFLPLIFAILHLSYGSGFLLGLVKFWNRWADKKGKTPVWES